jgi:NTE family protein
MNLFRSSEADPQTLSPSILKPQQLPRQVVTLACLNQGIPASGLGGELARGLSAETKASVVLVRLEPLDESGRMRGGELPSCALNGEFHLPPELCFTDGRCCSIALGVGVTPPSPAGIASLVDQLSSRFRYVLVVAIPDHGSAQWVSELLSRSDLAYLFLKPTREDFAQLDAIALGTGAVCKGGVNVQPVVCLADGERFDDFSLPDLTSVKSLCGVIHDCPSYEPGNTAKWPTQFTRSFGADVRRLAREIGGCSVGLALSSGAAKGFAHVGVIQVLEENGIEVDVIAGASMGAYVGALWAFGCDGGEMESLAHDLEKRWALWSLIDPAFPPRRGFIRGFAVKRRLMRTIGGVQFAGLTRPLRVVAANLATLERKVFASGEVAAAVHASVAVPGICVPITIDGEIYTDGGIVDPLPVDVLREMGISKVIAVNVIPTPERIVQGIRNKLEEARRNEQKGRARLTQKSSLNRQVNYFARGNVLEVLMRSVQGAQIRMAEASCQMADLVLRPEIFDDSWLDYRNPGRFIKLGREAAEKHLEEIKLLVTKKETIHGQKFAPEPVAAAD